MTDHTALTSLLSPRYTLDRELGRGGMATVYLAEERKHSRQVAIKVLRDELATSIGAERFLREIGIAARLAHPHIVPLIDSGEAAGHLYYVAAYVNGGSLRERLDREGRLPVAEALRITREIGGALDFAHRAGFIHRDVKPENILFADGHAQLTDFGVARVCCGDRPDHLTGEGLAIGTPEYMSPEQASGSQDLDSRSDIYSLACVLYEMLGGDPPFAGSNPRAIMARHVTEAPKPVRTLRPDAPGAVERALARALAKDPAGRFASIADFISALGAPETDLPYATAAARSIAVLPFVNASADPENEYLSDGITDELIDALTKVQGLRVASRSSVFALKGKPQDIRAIGALLGASVVLEGTVRKSGNRLRITAQLGSTEDGRLIWSERYDRTLADVFAIQEEIAATIVSTLRATTFADLAAPVPRRYTENLSAYALYLRGRHAWNKRTQQGVEESIHFFKGAIAEDPNYALGYTGLADAYALENDYRDIPVREGFERAKEYARRAIALDDSLAEAHASLAWTLFIYDWDWDASRREFQRAIELDPRYATARQWYGFRLAAGGHLDEALVEGHSAQELDPASVSIRRTLGWLYYYSRRFGQARHHLEHAVMMNPAAEETYRVLGLTLAMDGKLDEAEHVLREALAMPGAAAYTKATLAYTLGRAGKRPEAEQLQAELQREHEGAYISPVAFATIALGLGDWERALALTERALEERRGWVAYLDVNPIFDPVREHPRFRALVRRMRLAEL